MVEIIAEWKDGIHFETDAPGGIVNIDGHEDVGGQEKGNRPKALMLVGLAGCTGIDVKTLLAKMRVFPDGISIIVQAELTEDHPKYYHKTHIIYQFKGENLDEEKIKKAITLSVEKYCGVIYMFKQFSDVSWEVQFH